MLNVKQSRFCLEYIIDFNATQAAVRTGYSKKTSGKIGFENLQKPEIQAEINRLIAERTAEIKIDANYVLKRLVEIDQLDILDLFQDSGKLKDVKNWSKAWRTSINALDIQEFMFNNDVDSLVKKVKFPDKLKNLELIGRHIKIQAFGKEDINDQDIPDAISYPYTVRNAVSEVKVTIGEGKGDA